MTDAWLNNVSKALGRQLEVAREVSSRMKSPFGSQFFANETDAAIAKRWQATSRVIIRDSLGEHEAKQLDIAQAGTSYSSRSSEGDRFIRSVGFVRELKTTIDKYPSQILYSEPAITRKNTASSGPNNGARKAVGSKVFLIHGHDEPNTLRLARHLEQHLKLEVVILQDRPGSSRTLIEKLEHEAASCGYAFALLTPDDNVETTEGSYVQARPNVVFELGWFMGRLQRSRVCLIVKRGTSMHSDLDGINRIEFDDNVLEATHKIEGELREAGIPQVGQKSAT